MSTVESMSETATPPKPKGTEAQKRIRELVGKVKSLQAELRARNEEKEQLRREQELPEVTEAINRGRAIFPDFDQMLNAAGTLSLDQRAVRAIAASPDGPELLYCLAVGALAVQQRRTEQARIEFYRQQHQKHFAATGV